MFKVSQAIKAMSVIPVFVLMIIGPGDYAFAQPVTKVAELEQLSLEFADQLQSQRPQLYYDLLNSSEKPQLQLNQNRDIQLMSIGIGDKPFYYAIENLNAAQTVSTDDVWPGGSGGFSLSGSSTTLGKLCVWDGGGVLLTHQELAGRVTQIDSPSGTHYHSTHVAGTMIASGVVASAKGMSYQGTLAAYEWTNDDAEMAAAAASGINISSHSYGYITGWYYSSDWYWYGDITISPVEDYGFGFYSDDAQAWDAIAYNAPYYTIVKSAGNDRDDGLSPGEGHWVWDSGSWVWSNDTRDIDGGSDGYDCVSWNGTAKNIITVGAVYDISGGYSNPGDVVMSSFSGWGPTDDGRIKPDIVANGIGLYSCMDDANDSYYSLGGTSMSTPNVSGSLNLLVRYFETTHIGTTPLSSTAKALIIQTADEAGSYAGPDYKFGWGLMNTLKAIELIQADSASNGYIIEDSLNNSDTREYYITANGVDPVRITICWTDPPGSPPSPSLNPTTIMLVNDLDIRLENLTSATVYYPYTLNPASPGAAAGTGDNIRDNVEQIYLTSPSSGSYRLTISHKGSLSSTQFYSLASSYPLGGEIENDPPIALCQNDSVYISNGCEADASIDDGSYDPDDDPITLGQVPAGPYPLGQTLVSLMVTDNKGGADTCQATVTVLDTIPPQLDCPENMIVGTDPDDCGAIVEYSVTATDNCSSVTIDVDPESGSFFETGTTVVWAVAHDQSGNVDSCVFNVTVIDDVPPVISCPDNIIADNDPAQCGAVIEFAIDAADNCSEVTISSNPLSGAFFEIGMTPVRVIGQDDVGNADTCYFMVTVNDNEPPEISCPDDIVSDNDPGQCGAVIEFATDAADNCPGVTIATEPPSGAFFDLGITPVRIIAGDAADNADTCFFNVIIEDNEKPIISCPGDTVLNYDPEISGAILEYESTIEDNCAIGSFTCNPLSGSLFGLGSTIVTCIGLDSTGNADTCAFTVTVIVTGMGYEYLPGDVNMAGGTWPPAATGPDVTYLVNFFRGTPTSVACKFDGDSGLFWASADANGDCNIIGSDVTKLVNVFRGIGGIEYCVDYEPAWPTPADLPAEAPDGWPACD